MCCADEQLNVWRGRYAVHPDAIYRISLFECELSLRIPVFVKLQECPDALRATDVVGVKTFRPVSSNRMLTSDGRRENRAISSDFSAVVRFAFCSGFKFEQEPVLSYISRTMVEDPASGLWLIAIEKRVVRVCASLFGAVFQTLLSATF